jgi:AcrR family transcriptional regulator
MVKGPPGRKRQRTRAALVEATLAIIADEGFAVVTLDAVAARAGVTKGAIYSNFRGKGELLWEAVGAKSLRLEPRFEPGATLRENARAVARALIAQMPQAERDGGFHGQLHVYIATDPELRALQTAEYEALFDSIADQLRTLFGERLVMPARSVALAVQALLWGFLHQWSQTPDAVTEEVIAEAFEALAIGATTAPNPSQVCGPAPV